MSVKNNRKAKETETLLASVSKDNKCGSYGLLYRYGNKSRRKVPSIFFIILSILVASLPLCDGENKIVRVDPLGSHTINCN